nr:MAG TPA: Protein of unknown function (DUF3568) [Caudoviricetes sp.]
MKIKYFILFIIIILVKSGCHRAKGSHKMSIAYMR